MCLNLISQTATQSSWMTWQNSLPWIASIDGLLLETVVKARLICLSAAILNWVEFGGIGAAGWARPDPTFDKPSEASL